MNNFLVNNSSSSLDLIFTYYLGQLPGKEFKTDLNNWRDSSVDKRLATNVKTGILIPVTQINLKRQGSYLYRDLWGKLAN